MALFVEPHDPRQFESSKQSTVGINAKNTKISDNVNKGSGHSNLGHLTDFNPNSDSDSISNSSKGSGRMRELILDLRSVNYFS